MNLASGKGYMLNGTTVLSGTTLGSSIVTSSLTSVGTLGSLDVTGAVTAGSFSGSGASLTALNADNLASGTVPDARFPILLFLRLVVQTSLTLMLLISLQALFPTQDLAM